MFDITKSKVNKAIVTRSLLHIFRALRTLCLIVFISSIVYLIWSLFGGENGQILLDIFALSIFALSLFVIFFVLVFFLEDYIRRPRRLNREEFEKDGINLADFLTAEAGTIIKKALIMAKKRKLDGVNSSILLFFIINHKNPRVDFIFTRLLIDKSGLAKRVSESMLETKDYQEGTGLFYSLEAIILEAAKASIRRKGMYIKTNDILSALSKIEPNLKEELRRRGLDKKDIDNLNYWQDRLLRRVADDKRWWDRKNLKKVGSIARDWTSGWTPTLDRYSLDLTNVIKRVGFMDPIGHFDERAEAERILIRESDNNVLFVGENGSGKMSIIRAMCQRSFLNNSFKELNDKRFLELNISMILTSTSSLDEVEALLDKCFSEALLAGNIILVLSDFDSYLSESTKAGSVDISSMIAPYLRYSEFRFIATTTYEGLHKYIELKPHILSFFEKIEVPPLNEYETLLVMEREVLGLEVKYRVFITYPAILKMIELSGRYIHEVPFPRKAITLLNDVVVYAKNEERENIILEEHVEKVLSEQTEIPIGSIGAEEKEKLINLEDLIHKRVINQSEAINEISSALRRARSGIGTRKGPMGSFLFMGPTGVGKTETAKALSEVYFGSESKMIRFDMSEFQIEEDVKRFIGENDDPGLFAVKVRESPFSLILLDEIEKAHPNILNLFLQVLDEGFMTDSLGRKIDFSNTIIIATSNAGYKIILEALKETESTENIKQKILDYVFEEGIYRPEFINRFDATVIFRALTRANLLDISELRLQKIKGNLLRKHITLVISEKVKAKIVELSYNPQFGAREMRRVIQDKIENVLAKAFLMEEIREGDTISINDNFEIKIEKTDFK